MAQNLRLEVIRVLIPKSTNLAAEIAVAIQGHKDSAARRSMEIVKPPIADAQPSLFNPEMVEITTRALVKRATHEEVVNG